MQVIEELFFHLPWQSEDLLTRNNTENIWDFLDWVNIAELIENIEVWNSLLSLEFNKSLLDKEFLKLWITR